MRQNVVRNDLVGVDAKLNSVQCYTLAENAYINKFMGLGTDMKSLVDDIVTSREDRTKMLEDIRKDSRHARGEAKKILSDARSMMKDFAKEDKERAEEVKKLGHEVKSFLKSSAESRKVDFSATMKTVHGSLEGVRKDSKHARNAGKTIVKDARALITSIAKNNKEQAKELHEELKKSDHHRKTAFKSMMSDIGEDLKEVKGDVTKVKKDARDMVSRYHHSRVSAQKHWASLSPKRKKAKEQKSEE